jgi:import inner membrane translocase subunit TIM22
MDRLPILAPLFPAGSEPLPPGIPETERAAFEQQKRMEKYIGMAYESCATKSAISGVMGESAISVRALSSQQNHNSSEPYHLT